jgi:hypothetical protein
MRSIFEDNDPDEPTDVLRERVELLRYLENNDPDEPTDSLRERVELLRLAGAGCDRAISP